MENENSRPVENVFPPTFLLFSLYITNAFVRNMLPCTLSLFVTIICPFPHQCQNFLSIYLLHSKAKVQCALSKHELQLYKDSDGWHRKLFLQNE